MELHYKFLFLILGKPELARVGVEVAQIGTLNKHPTVGYVLNFYFFLELLAEHALPKLHSSLRKYHSGTGPSGIHFEHLGDRLLPWLQTDLRKKENSCVFVFLLHGFIGFWVFLKAEIGCPYFLIDFHFSFANKGYRDLAVAINDPHRWFET